MKRPFLLFYGTGCYILFNLVFLYLAGFLLHIGVPKAINDGSSASLVESLMINFGLVFLFGFTHSVMARERFKKWWTTIIPFEAERSTFVLQSSMFLALAMWQWRPIEAEIWSLTGPSALLAYAGFILGVAIVLISTFLIDHFELFGLRQVWFANQDKPTTEQTFRTPFLYKLVRHPMQLGLLILLFSTPVMTIGHLTFAASMTAYIFVGLYFEERSLRRSFGQQYAEYQAHVPMLIPTLLPLRAYGERSTTIR